MRRRKPSQKLEMLQLLSRVVFYAKRAARADMTKDNRAQTERRLKEAKSSLIRRIRCLESRWSLWNTHGLLSLVIFYAGHIRADMSKKVKAQMKCNLEEAKGKLIRRIVCLENRS